jgi:hypothetical protein
MLKKLEFEKNLKKLGKTWFFFPPHLGKEKGKYQIEKEKKKKKQQ